MDWHIYHIVLVMAVRESTLIEYELALAKYFSLIEQLTIRHKIHIKSLRPPPSPFNEHV